MRIILTLILSHPVSRKQRLDEALVDMIVKDGQPSSMVEDEGFRNFVKILDPSYTIPSRKSVKAMVEARYNIIRQAWRQDFHLRCADVISARPVLKLFLKIQKCLYIVLYT